MIVWLLAQLVFWVALTVAFLGVMLAVVLAPPYFAIRFILRRSCGNITKA